MQQPQNAGGDDDVAQSREDLIDSHPLLSVFGDTARPRIIATLLTAHEPLNPDRIVERSGVSTATFYNHIDGLLASGIVEQTGNAGNSPLYDIVEDDREAALNVISSKTGIDEAEDNDPEPPNN